MLGTEFEKCLCLFFGGIEEVKKTSEISSPTYVVATYLLYYSRNASSNSCDETKDFLFCLCNNFLTYVFQ